MNKEREQKQKKKCLVNKEREQKQTKKKCLVNKEREGEKSVWRIRRKNKCLVNKEREGKKQLFLFLLFLPIYANRRFVVRPGRPNNAQES